jgi:hypothetical protein
MANKELIKVICRCKSREHDLLIDRVKRKEKEISLKKSKTFVQ